MNQLKIGTFLIVLGNLLYLAFTFFTGNETSSFGDFCSGLLVGLSIGCNFIGIILIVAYMAKKDKEEDKK